MKVNELNEYIFKYIKFDETNQALLINGEWGIGKTYYITNHLIPFLNEKEIKCINISLYGVSTISDICSELVLKLLDGNKYIDNKLIKIISGSIIQRVGLKLSRKEIRCILESINFNNKLIIFEDMERTNICLKDLLGFIYNLVDERAIKVLLVANEKELEKNTNYTDSKEKTIRDTIHFMPNIENSIISIISHFDNKILNDFLSIRQQELVANIIEIMNHNEIFNFNLRSFKYGCQRTIEIYNLISTYNREFLLSIFFGNIAYILKKKKDDKENRWESLSYISSDLTIPKYPIYKFAFEYIERFTFDENLAQECNNRYLLDQKEKSSEDKNNEILSELYSYYLSDENKVQKLIHKLLNLLKSTSFDLETNIKILNYAIAIKYDVINNYEICECIDKCRKSILSEMTSEDIPHVYFEVYDFINNEAREELNDIKMEVYQNVKIFKDNLYINSYNINELPSIISFIYASRNKYLNNKTFMKYFDIEKLKILLSQCNASQVSDIRKCFLRVYSFNNLSDYFKDDYNSLTILRKYIEDEINKKIDNVKKLQYKFFIYNLDNIINKLR